MSYKKYTPCLPTFNPFAVSCHSKLLTIHSIKLPLGESLSSATVIFIVPHRLIARSASTVDDTNQSPGLPGRRKSRAFDYLSWSWPRSLAQMLDWVSSDAHISFFASPHTFFSIWGCRCKCWLWSKWRHRRKCTWILKPCLTQLCNRLNTGDCDLN